MRKIKWGVLGCGGIANKFATSIQPVETAELVACASNTPGKARDFAQKHAIYDAYDNYPALLEREDLDAVYVATTHNFHHENGLAAMEAGKAVLCEKPLATTAAEARSMAAKAKETGCFLMEGMWTRFLPAIQQMKSWIREGRIGEVKTLRATFAIGFPFDPDHRLYNPDLAGGALLDAGIYPVSLASFLMEEQPEAIAALAEIGQTGVDEQTNAVFRYRKGRMAILGCAVSSPSENRVEVIGTAGRIVIPAQFIGATEVELHQPDGEQTMKRIPFQAKHGFTPEIRAVTDDLLAGRRENEVMPIAETVAVAETLDRILAQIH